MTWYDKPFKTLPEQIALLRSRGMHIGDESAASAHLLAIGYYRLSGYWYTFRESAPPCAVACACRSHRADTFVAGTSLDQVVELYEFDRALRLLVLDAIERVEVALRMRLGHVLGEGSAFAHLDPALLETAFTRFDDRRPQASRSHWLGSEHAKWLSKVRAEEDRSKEDFVVHFKARYGMPLPVWVVTELLTFGSLVTLVGGLKRRQKNLIAETFGVFDADCEGDGAAFGSWVSCLAYLRNICAHHGRLWNRNIVEQFGRLDVVAELEHASAPRAKSRVYAPLAVLAFLTSQIDPTSTWRLRVTELLADRFDTLGMSYAHMGFVDNWTDEALWSAGYVPAGDPIPAEHREILRHFECMGTAEAGMVVDPSPVARRRSSAVRYLRSKNHLLGLPVGKSYRFPSFQFDVGNQSLHPVVRKINIALNAGPEPWRAARWWITANGGAHGRAPLTMLGSRADQQLLEAAQIAPPHPVAATVRVADLPAADVET
ncbi:Abi family protein [Nocardia thailandica]|uniref:Abi family protein n=1 Tax=Nocardia thailandica TaxID=257275 RepID=A0ABW6PFP5_9NOCA